jgi:hypothetical protein
MRSIVRLDRVGNACRTGGVVDKTKEPVRPEVLLRELPISLAEDARHKTKTVDPEAARNGLASSGTTVQQRLSQGSVAQPP